MRHVLSFRSLVQSLTRSSRHAIRPTNRGQFTPRMEVLEDLTLPASIFWNNPLGGDWATASNWSTGTVPGASDQVTIDLPGDYTVTHATGNHQVLSLTSYRNFRLTGGTLRTQNASQFYGALTINAGMFSSSSPVTAHRTLDLLGGTVQIAGNLDVRGLMTWSGGLMTGAGQTDTREGIRFTFTGINGLDGRTLNNYGRVEWTGTNRLVMRNGAVFNNMPGAIFLVQNQATFLGDSEARGGIFNNHGIFRVDAGAADFLRPINQAGVVFNNFNQVQLNGGNMTLARGGTNAGLVHMGFNRSLVLPSETFNVNLNSTFSGEGWIRVQGATVSVNTNVQARNLALASGMVTGNNTLTVAGTLSWTGGQFQGTGQTVVAAGAQLDISGAADKIIQMRTLQNAGTATWTGAGNLVFRSDSRLENATGATFDIRTDAAMIHETGNSAVVNRGMLRKGLTNGVTDIAVWTDNRGTVDVQSGTLRFGSGTGTGNYLATGTLEFAPQLSAQHVLQAGSRVSGTGTVIFSGDAEDVSGIYALTGHTRISGGNVTIRNSVSTGQLTVQGGNVTFLGHMTVNGLFTWTGGEIRAVGQVYANGGLSIGGEADKVFREGTLSHSGIATWTGSGTLAFESGASFVNRPGATFNIQTDALISFSGAFGDFLNQGTLRKWASAGTTVFSGVIVNHGTVALDTGRLENYGGIDNRANITVAAGATFAVDSLISAATARLTGAGDVEFASFTSLVDGVYDITGDTHVIGAVAIMGATRTGSLRNHGAIYMGPASTVAVTGNFIQGPEAATQLDGGILTVGGQIDLQGGVALAHGVINGQVRNAGRLVIADAGLAGQLVINGNYTQTATGILDIEIGGIEAGYTYDQFAVTGQTVLDGTLNLMLLEGFSANLNDNFHILTWGNRTGEFAQINGLELGEEFYFEPTYEASGLDLWTIQR